MIAAGWCYDPSPEYHDGVTCPYCNLSLDAWDAGDDPMEEHKRRAKDCLFFTLKELYHPANIPYTTAGKAKAPRVSRKRASSSSKRTSTTKKTSRKASVQSSVKSKQAAKRESTVSISSTESRMATRGTTRSSSNDLDTTLVHHP